VIGGDFLLPFLSVACCFLFWAKCFFSECLHKR
jgi:hypothetical protein